MSDYYKNLTLADVAEVLPAELFSTWDAYYNAQSHDLYFAGIKKGGSTDALRPYGGASITALK